MAAADSSWGKADVKLKNLNFFNQMNRTKMTMKNLKMLVLAFVAAFVVVACSDDESDESTVKGTAAKGYIANGDVNVYAYTEAGARGKLLGTTKTDAQGRYSVRVKHRGPVEVVVKGGTYKDEASGENVNMGNHELRAVVIVDAEAETAAITALTTIAASYVDAHASAGVETAIANANTRVAAAFGLSGINIVEVVPSDFSLAAATHTEAQLKYGLVQAGLSQVVKSEGMEAAALLDLVADLSADFSDEKFDNSKAGIALELSLSLAPKQAVTNLNAAIQAFLESSANVSGHTDLSVTVPQPE